MLKFVVCDDNKEIAAYVESCINDNISVEKKINVFETGYAMEYYVTEIAKGDVDIIITDIDLCELNGIDIIKDIIKEFPLIKIIFISGHQKYIQRVFETDLIYFILKPIDEKLLTDAINKAISHIEEEKEKSFTFITKLGIFRLPYKSIKYIVSNGRQVSIYEMKNVREINSKLDNLEKDLPSNFLRCHKSYIINLDKVKSLSDKAFVLNTGEIIPISQSKYSESKDSFINYLGKKL